MWVQEDQEGKKEPFAAVFPRSSISQLWFFFFSFTGKQQGAEVPPYQTWYDFKGNHEKGQATTGNTGSQRSVLKYIGEVG